MAKLKDRQRQIPNGLKFHLPEVKYKSSPFASFDSICNSVHTIVQANLELAIAKGWPTDMPAIRDWVDTYNANLCEMNKWTDYYDPTPGSTPDFSHVPHNEWPLWAKALKLLSNDKDGGVGDTLARVIGDETSEAFKNWYKATFGKVCGCNGRRIEWNHKYSYK